MGRGDEEGKIHGMGSVKRGESRWRRVEVRERGGGGGCSNERNLHDFACFSASWLRPSGFSFLPTFSACFSGCSHPATQERGRRREEEEEEKEGVASRCELLREGEEGRETGNYFSWFFSAEQWNIDGQRRRKEERRVSRGWFFQAGGKLSGKTCLTVTYG